VALSLWKFRKRKREALRFKKETGIETHDLCIRFAEKEGPGRTRKNLGDFGKIGKCINFLKRPAWEGQKLGRVERKQINHFARKERGHPMLPD